MSSKRKISIGLSAIALAAGFYIGQPAVANDLGKVLDFLEDVLESRGGYAGDYAEHRASNRLNAERAEMHDRITAAVNSGEISAWEAGNFRAQLQHNANLQAQYASDGLFTFSEARSVWSGLNSLDSRLLAAVGDGLAFPNRHAVNTAEVDRLTMRISNRLEQGRSNGNLTATEYRNLRRQLDRIRFDRQQMAYSGGRLSWGEVQSLMDRLDGVNDLAMREMRDREIAGRANRYWY
jgi:ElaB/YqjD/DUF883 family membrane-anchored ribosome-binding protein